MSGFVDPNDWRTWPRSGNRVDAPPSSTDQRFVAMWALTREEY